MVMSLLGAGVPRATRVLVIEDDEDIRSSLCSVLSGEGYSVSSSRNGREALAQLRSEPRPDVILLDLMMPVMNGTEFRAAQLQVPELASIPVVVLTADLCGRELAGTPRVAAVFRKPFDVGELLDTIDSVAGGLTGDALALA